MTPLTAQNQGGKVMTQKQTGKPKALAFPRRALDLAFLLMFPGRGHDEALLPNSSSHMFL